MPWNIEGGSYVKVEVLHKGFYQNCKSKKLKLYLGGVNTNAN